MGRSIEALQRDQRASRRMRCASTSVGRTSKGRTSTTSSSEIVDLLYRATGRDLGRGRRPRHGHEWAVFEEFALPDEKYLLPGVIDTTTNFVEHPELVAQRIDRYVRTLGAERVVRGDRLWIRAHAGAGVSVDVMWAKLASLVECAPGVPVALKPTL